MRPELNQATLLAERGDLELVRTRNGMLPRMDLFVTLGSSGYADSFSNSWRSLDGDYDDVLAGLRFELPVRRSEARAQHERAEVEKAQADKGVENLRLLVEMDVRLARIEVERARQQIAASGRTREQDEEKLRAEAEKFGIGRASAFQVARAQRDLVRSRLAEAAALADAHKALVELYRLDGSLLVRRGILAPGQPTSTTSLIGSPSGSPTPSSRLLR
jgi:outer membrane protein TolC